MPATPEGIREKIRAYYEQTTEPFCLPWAGESLAIHVGMSNGPTPPDDVDPDAARVRSLLALNVYLAERARIVAGTHVLDAGCGVGGSSIWLAREHGATAVGITLHPGQVELARRFAAERGVSGVRFEVMDYSATTFEEASFDVVWNLESFCHAADARGYLRHVFDLLRDGGRFACVDFFRGSGGDPADAEGMCEGWVLPDLQSMEAVTAMLSEIGFSDVEQEDVTPRVLPFADIMREKGRYWSAACRWRELAGMPTGDMVGGHFRAAVRAADGLRSGALEYAYVGAVRPPRG